MMRESTWMHRFLWLAGWLASAAAFMNFNQPCKPFECSKHQLLVPKLEFEYTANGCGRSQLPIQADVDFSNCCNWHDVCYSTCGMKKKQCEKRLDKCMKEKCETIGDAEQREKCHSTAKLFSVGAQLLACPAYQDAQREACRCVDKDDAPGAVRERVERFLEAVGAPAEEQSQEAIDALLKKYSGQESKMFYRLLVKYPKAIRLDQTKRNFMEDVFKSPLDGYESTGPKKDTFGIGLEEENEEMQESREESASKLDKFAVGQMENEGVDEHIEL